MKNLGKFWSLYICLVFKRYFGVFFYGYEIVYFSAYYVSIQEVSLLYGKTLINTELLFIMF